MWILPGAVRAIEVAASLDAAEIAADIVVASLIEVVLEEVI